MKTFQSLSTVTVLALIALCLSTVNFFRSAPAAASLSSDTVSAIQKKGVINVCYAVWPPAVIKDATTGKLSGHDIDALEYIASQIGVKIEYHESTFGNMATAVASGECDIGTSLFVKVPRAAVVSFSQPLFFAGNSALVRRGDTRFKTIEDANKKGIRVAVANGESGHIFAKEHLPNATIIPIDVESSDLSRFLLEVTSGRADIGVADAVTIKLFAAAHPETTDLFANAPFDINPDAWPMRLGDTAFQSLINNSLLYMETSGKWTELEQKYDAHWLHEVKNYQVR